MEGQAPRWLLALTAAERLTVVAGAAKAQKARSSAHRDKEGVPQRAGAGSLGTARRVELTVGLKRVHGQMLAEWCGKHHVGLNERLGWGTMRRFWECQGVPASMEDGSLLADARTYKRHGPR